MPAVSAWDQLSAWVLPWAISPRPKLWKLWKYLSTTKLALAAGLHLQTPFLALFLNQGARGSPGSSTSMYHVDRRVDARMLGRTEGSCEGGRHSILLQNRSFASDPPQLSHIIVPQPKGVTLLLRRCRQRQCRYPGAKKCTRSSECGSC